MPVVARPKLDDQLCFMLYSASMAVGRTYKPLLDALGITYPQYLVLSTLWERDGRSVGGIADALALESSTVTPVIRRLVTAGLIDRQRNQRDDRQVVVSLTGAGREMRERCACLGETLVAVSGMSIERLLNVVHEVRAVRDALARPIPKP
jgi:DNA-binding MarR family transcriptional regulator